MSTTPVDSSEPPSQPPDVVAVTVSEGVPAAGTSQGESNGMNPATRRVDRRLAKLKNHHLHALHAIRHFLRTHSSYDVLPVSFRLVVLDIKLSVKSALDVMFQSGVVSAPLWRSTIDEDDADHTSSPPIRPGFAGMITVNDIIHLIQYYYQTAVNYDSVTLDVETLRLERLREIEQALHVPPPPLLWIAPLRSLAEAGELLVRTHARRIPLLQYDEDLKIFTVLSVLTQYRLLKFIAMNCREVTGLKATIGSLGIGTYTYAHQLERQKRTPHARLRMTAGPPPKDAGPYWPMLTATLDTSVFDVVHLFSENEISAVPIIDEQGDVVDIYESVDVITLLRTGVYSQLDLTIRQALDRRPADYTGVACCTSNDSLASVFAVLKHRRMHRMLVVEPMADADEERALPKAPNASFLDDADISFPLRPKCKLVGMLSLSDVLRYIIGKPTAPAPTPGEPSSTIPSPTSATPGTPVTPRTPETPAS
ncbi:AMP-activated serine/threonine-protein kinase regulatory subunit [Malassezia pachydermatis]|uniref:Cbs-domain-containing protein n=1 Tax=Malassezia pachydermatis TaxID=77020 RepID=A0A0M8MQQ7_9BASI|nr:cbs-domain-containing protein [Malassezia pachydermatis]KOS16428.1 cbs-domain-containing protein [Malassezia pachydermatis]